MNWAMEKAVEPIAEYYGLVNQLNMLQEECGELIQAVSKILRAKSVDAGFIDYYQASEMVIEEMGDVEILLAQIRYLLGPETKGKIESIQALKIARQKERISKDIEAAESGKNGNGK